MLFMVEQKLKGKILDQVIILILPVLHTVSLLKPTIFTCIELY